MSIIENFTLYITDHYYYNLTVYKYKIGIPLWYYDGWQLNEMDNTSLFNLAYTIIE